MYSKILLVVAFLLALPGFSSSETWEEFQKLKASEEQNDFIPKGGPRLIPKDAIVEALKKDCQFTFQSDALLFHYGLPKIKEVSMPNVQNTAAAIRQALDDSELSQIQTYYVDGHTCAIGSDENNCRLSWSRAQAVIDELAKLGVPREKLVPRGFGKTYPSHSNDTEATRVLNRRVVLKGDCARVAAKDNAVPCQMKSLSESGMHGGTTAQTEYGKRQPVDSSELVKGKALPRGYKKVD